MPLLTVFIPAYNVAAYIAEAIQSVKKQTFADWQLFIIDDASIDGTFNTAFIAAAADPRITFIRNEINLGMVQNWNKGLSYCNTPFFAKLDGDDKWHPQLLERSIAVLNNNKNVGIVFSRFIKIDGDGNEIVGTDIQLPDFAADRAFSCIPLVKQGPDQMLSYPVLRQGLSVMRKEILTKAGIYKYLLTEETQAAADTEFYFRVGAHFDIFCIDDRLYYYREHHQSISALDARDNMEERKLFELKVAILNYYGKCGLISTQERARFLSKVFSSYAFAEIAEQRSSKAFKAMFIKLLKQLLREPRHTIGFYCNRMSEKLANGR
jgi:glycosyltransferase involved in cell wall biosynthesis